MFSVMQLLKSYKLWEKTRKGKSMGLIKDNERQMKPKRLENTSEAMGKPLGRDKGQEDRNEERERQRESWVGEEEKEEGERKVRAENKMTDGKAWSKKRSGGEKGRKDGGHFQASTVHPAQHVKMCEWQSTKHLDVPVLQSAQIFFAPCFLLQPIYHFYP